MVSSYGAVEPTKSSFGRTWKSSTGGLINKFGRILLSSAEPGSTGFDVESTESGSVELLASSTEPSSAEPPVEPRRTGFGRTN